MQSSEVKTSLELKEVCFKWTVDNWKVSSYFGSIISEHFEIPEKEVRFLLNLQISDTLDLYVSYLDCKKLEKCRLEAYILINNKKIALSHQCNLDMFNLGLVKMNKFHSSENYSSSINELVILCEVKYGSYTSEHTQSHDKNIILYDFNKLLSNEKLCDVTFLIDEQKINAHMAVLAAVSPYFLAMFEHPNTIENQKRVVDFRNDKDVTAQNFRGFLEYIYGGKSIVDLSAFVSDLLILADKFDVEPLRNMCEHYISVNIDEKNVVDIILLSDKYHCKFLKEKALCFAKKHIDVVKASKKLNELCKLTSVIQQLL